jgi:putative alpha-1,2-mannosidase
VHGIEPSYHVIYLFNATGDYAKTHIYVRDVITKIYRPVIDGLGGNDDCGHMPAWYLFSALEFYPTCPSSQIYELDSPTVISARILLSNSKELNIETVNQSDSNVYVVAVYWNNQRLTSAQINQGNLIQGGVLRFEMVPKPVRTFK